MGGEIINSEQRAPLGAPPRAVSEPAEGGLAQGVFEQLLGRIRAGVFAQGERLPSETRLAAEFDVSRPIVRAALAQLRQQGLIVSRRGSGSFVAESAVAPATGFAPLKSVADIAAWYDFRKIIEPEIAALAASSASPVGVERIRAAALQLEARLDAGGSGVELDIVLHATIAETAGNRFLRELLAMLRPQLFFVASFARDLGRTGYLSGMTHARAEHRAIVDAIARCDPEASRAAMRAHIEGSQRRVFTGS